MMSPIEAQAARRRAELLWQQKTREAAAAEASVLSSRQAEAQSARLAIDAFVAGQFPRLDDVLCEVHQRRHLVEQGRHLGLIALEKKD